MKRAKHSIAIGVTLILLAITVSIATASTIFSESFAYPDGSVPESIEFDTGKGSVHDLSVQDGKLRATLDTYSYGDYATVHWSPKNIVFSTTDMITIEFEGFEKPGYHAGNNYASVNVMSSEDSILIGEGPRYPLLTVLVQNRHPSSINSALRDKDGNLIFIERDLYTVVEGTHHYRIELNHYGDEYSPGLFVFYRDGIIEDYREGITGYLSPEAKLWFTFVCDDPYGATYTWDDVIVEAVSPVLDIGIDIKPGSYPNSINLNSIGKVPVALITTPDFDAREIEVDSVQFANAVPVRSSFEDIDADGDLDLILHFKTQDLSLTSEAVELELSGTTISGREVLGSDSVRIVP